MQTVKIATARALVAAGAVRAASLIGQPGGWAIVLRVGVVEQVIEAKRGGVRLLRTLDAGARVLDELGIRRFDVDASNLSDGLRL